MRYGPTIIGVLAVLGVVYLAYLKQDFDREAIKEGLQQCLIDNNIIWQKECG